ncbi:MAG: amidase domain-containing protein [Lachnospiraceae bacterium]|nr:amidase domain-containing protein [Lachnospiraceae bacterium]
MRERRILALVLVILICFENFAYASSTYSGQSVAQYANTWADSHNPNYPLYSNGDCTNFSSQCIVAGGFPTITLPDDVVTYDMLGGSYKSYAYFSNQKYTKTKKYLFVIKKKKTDFVGTTPWTCAGEPNGSFFGFFNYVSYKGLIPISFTTNSNNIDSLCLYACIGDVIQLQSKGAKAGDTYHSMVVVGKTYDSKSKTYDIKLSAHSSARKNVSIRYLIKDEAIKKDDTIYLLRITKADLSTMARKIPKEN